MRKKPSAIIFLLLGFSSALHGSAAPQVARDEPVALKPYVVTERIFAEAGFMINAKAKKGSKAATGVTTVEAFLVVIPKPDPRTIAGRAGLKDGDKIVEIGEVKTDGLSLRQFIEEFAKLSSRLSIPFVVSRQGSAERSVVLDFGTLPAKKAKPEEPNPPPEPTR